MASGTVSKRSERLSSTGWYALRHEPRYFSTVVVLDEKVNHVLDAGNGMRATPQMPLLGGVNQDAHVQAAQRSSVSSIEEVGT